MYAVVQGCRQGFEGNADRCRFYFRASLSSSDWTHLMALCVPGVGLRCMFFAR
ncbi:unnamed protein product [Ectocarpus sp. CCAP 1310/34]|nr:unnamed protein product [Ectocarpus sp. CCAP 1310/34]